MKSKTILFIALLFSFQLIAQTNGINYKAIVKDDSGNILAGAGVTVEFNILAGSGQTLIYNEAHPTTTDANGLIVLTIGQGTSSGVFDDIDWNGLEHYLNVKMDTGSGSGLVDLGTTQFEAVPYALQAEASNVSDLATTANTLKLQSGTIDQFTISYGTSGDKLQISEVGITGNVLEISNGELYLPQYAGGATDANLIIDINGKLVKEVPNAITEQSYNIFDFSKETPFSGAIRLDRGIQFEDGTTITGLKSWLLDNEPGANNGIQNTPFVSLHRLSKSDQTASTEEIFRIEGVNTATDVFQQLTTTSPIVANRAIVDNSNYIYLFRVFLCDNCDMREVTVME